MPTQPRLNDQGQVVNVVTEQTAAQYGVKPGVVNIGDTLTSTSSSSSSTAGAAPQASTASEPVVSKAVATSYADTASKQIAQDVYANAMSAQSMTESASGEDSVSSKKVAGKTTAKSWLMAIAEALGSALGQKAQQMLVSTNAIASLSQAGHDLTIQLEAANKNPESSAAAVQTIQSKQQDNAHDFTLETSRLQGAAQEFQMLQNAMIQHDQVVGRKFGPAARKG